jgi:hypothetical protein
MNPLTTFILVLLGLWSSIHIIHHLYARANRSSRTLLPTYLTSRSTSRRRISTAATTTTTTITLKGPYLRVESTALNENHDTLAMWLSEKSHTARVRRATLRVVFDLGIVVSLLGMAVALALLAWTFMLLARRSMDDLFPLPTTDVYPHAKRAYESDYVPPSTFPARPAPDVPIQLLVCISLPSCLPHSAYHDHEKSRYPESPSRFHNYLRSSAHCSYLKPYTKQGTHFQPRCSFVLRRLCNFGLLSTNNLPQRWRTASIPRRILDPNYARGFRRVPRPRTHRPIPTSPRAHRRVRSPPERTAVSRPRAPAQPPVPPYWLLRYFRQRFVSSVGDARFAIGIPSPSWCAAYCARRPSTRQCQRERVERLPNRAAFSSLR